MRIAVTGGSGFIGSNLIHHLFHRAGTPNDCCPGHPPGTDILPDLEILNLDALTYAGNPTNLHGIDHLPGYTFQRTDITNAPALHAALRNFQPDLTLHLAAESHVDRSIHDPRPFLRTNVEGTHNILETTRRLDTPLVHVSTDEVYGPIPEGAATEESPLHPANPYAASKAAADHLCLAAHNTHGTPVTITRCTNNWGPRQHPEKLIPTILRCLREGIPVPLYGDGMQRRDWIHVQDHCRALWHVSQLGAWGEVFNVAGHCEMTNLEVVQTLGAAWEHVADRPGHDIRYTVDDSKLRGRGWEPTTGMLGGNRATGRLG